MFRVNPLMKTDSYKTGHWQQFPPGTTNTYYYGESRGGRYGAILWFGLQGFCQDNLVGRYCNAQDVVRAADRTHRHGTAFNEEGWLRIVTKHEGKLPIRIKAVKEGTLVPTNEVPFTVESLDPELAWLPGWIETQILRGVWYPSTVGTKSYYCKKVIAQYLDETSNSPAAELPFKLHDFGARGASSGETACIGGAAHLANFKGTDTLEGVEWMSHHYGDGVDGIPGFSINAMEHSTVLAWGPEGEEDAFRNMLIRYAAPGKIIACVSDTYDYWNVVENIWGGELRDVVKKSGATVVIRPDSGKSPPEVVLRTCQILDRKIGCETNLRGFKVLPSFYRIIQGDGNDDETSVEAILAELKALGFAVELQKEIFFGDDLKPLRRWLKGTP